MTDGTEWQELWAVCAFGAREQIEESKNYLETWQKQHCGGVEMVECWQYFEAVSNRLVAWLGFNGRPLQIRNLTEDLKVEVYPRSWRMDKLLPLEISASSYKHYMSTVQIDSFGFSTPIHQAFRDADMQTIGSLVTKTKSELLDIFNHNQALLEEVADRLARVNLTLKGEKLDRTARSNIPRPPQGH